MCLPAITPPVMFIPHDKVIPRDDLAGLDTRFSAARACKATGDAPGRMTLIVIHVAALHQNPSPGWSLPVDFAKGLDDGERGELDGRGGGGRGNRI